LPIAAGLAVCIKVRGVMSDEQPITQLSSAV